MKKLFYLLLLVGCTAQQPELRTKTFSALDTLGTVGIVSSEYFEVSLGSVTYGDNPTFYIADHDLPASKEEVFKRLLLVNEADSVIHFENSTAFLNYMSARGYEMQEQRKKKYSTDYTFKRKQ